MRIRYPIVVFPATITGRDHPEKKIAFLRGRQTVLQIGMGRHRNGALVRHPDLVTKRRQKSVDSVQQFLNAVYGRRNQYS